MERLILITSTILKNGSLFKNFEHSLTITKGKYGIDFDDVIFKSECNEFNFIYEQREDLSSYCVQNRIIKVVEPEATGWRAVTGNNSKRGNWL